MKDLNPNFLLNKLEEENVIGCFPLYPPLELFHAMGLTPVILWGLKDSVENFNISDRHLQVFSCSIARELLQFTLAHEPDFECLFFYNACDTLRNLPDILQAGMRERDMALPFIRMHLPMIPLERRGASAYLEKQITTLITELEEFTGKSFDPEKFAESVDLYAQIRELSDRLEKMVASGKLSYADFSACLQANYFRSPETQLAELKNLEDNGSFNQPANGKQVGVLISGIQPPPLPIIELIESAGLQIVGNDVATQRRSYGYQPPNTKDPVYYFKQFYSNHFPCPTLLHTADKRPPHLVRFLEETGAKGIIFSAEKFCEYEYLEYPYLEKLFKERGINTLTLELTASKTVEDTGGYKTRIEAFAELLKN